MCIFCLSLSQVSSGAAIAGNMPGGHVSNRSVPRPINVGMQRVHQLQAYNLTSQAGMSSGINPAGIPMQRGVPQQAHQQQQVCCLFRKGVKYYAVLLFMVNFICYCCLLFDSWGEKTQWECQDILHSRNQDVCKVNNIVPPHSNGKGGGDSPLSLRNLAFHKTGRISLMWTIRNIINFPMFCRSSFYEQLGFMRVICEIWIKFYKVFEILQIAHNLILIHHFNSHLWYLGCRKHQTVYILVAIYQGTQSWIGRYQSNQNRPAYGQISTENCLAENPYLGCGKHQTVSCVYPCRYLSR